MKNADFELTQAQAEEMEAHDAIAEERVDTSDIPEVVDWSNSVQGLFHMSPEERTNALDKLRNPRSSTNGAVHRNDHAC